MSSPTYQFDDAIEVGRAERLTEGNRDVRRYHVEIKQNYVAAGAPFGGIILATVLNSLSRDFADPGNDAQPTKDKKVRWPHPLGCQATFLNIGKVGPAYVDVRRLKEGGRSAVAEAVLRQDQETKKGGFETMDILCVVATYGDLSAEEGPDYLSEKRPEIEFDEKNLEWKPTKEQPGIGFQVRAKQRDETCFLLLATLTRCWVRLQGLVERVTVLPTLQPSQPSNNPPPVVFHASRFADGRPNDVISLGFWCDMFNSPVRRIPELQKMGFRGMTMVCFPLFVFCFQNNSPLTNPKSKPSHRMF